MIIGIGNDIVEIDRIHRVLENEHFIEKYFRLEERPFINRTESLAANFAAKEALAKALGTGFRGFGPEQIAVLRDCAGKPYIQLHGEAKKRADQLGVNQIHVSVAHERHYAIANVILE